MLTTIHFGNSSTEFSLASAPATSGGNTSFTVTASDMVTPRAVYAAVNGAGSYVISTDGVTAAEVDNVVFNGLVGYDGSNITFSMRQKTADEIQKEQMQAQIDALGAQVAALTLGGAES